MRTNRIAPRVNDLSYAITSHRPECKDGFQEVAFVHFDRRLVGAFDVPSVSESEPAVQEAKGKPGDPIENAVRAQAVQVARQLQSAGPILVERVRSGHLKIVAAREDLDTGKVELLSI